MEKKKRKKNKVIIKSGTKFKRKLRSLKSEYMYGENEHLCTLFYGEILVLLSILELSSSFIFYFYKYLLFLEIIRMRFRGIVIYKNMFFVEDVAHQIDELNLPHKCTYTYNIIDMNFVSFFGKFLHGKAINSD